MAVRVAALCGLLFFGSGPLHAQTLPALPAAIAGKSELIVGVRCDQPPYGFKDREGNFAGVEVEMAKQIATYAFGSPAKAAMVCVTAENRIPQLVSGKVDLLIATLGKTPERARLIDYSMPYNFGSSDILVLKESPVTRLSEIKQAAPVAMLKGSTPAAWFDANQPDIETLRLNTIADALQALKQKRAGALAGDASTLIVIAQRDPAIRRLEDPFATVVGGLGVRKSEPEWLGYINAALTQMAQENRYTGWIEKWIEEDKWPLYKPQFPPAKMPDL